MKIQTSFNPCTWNFINNTITLNLQQKKVVMAVVGVFALLAVAALVYYSKCFKATKTEETQGQQGEKTPLPPTPSPDAISSQDGEVPKSQNQEQQIIEPAKPSTTIIDPQPSENGLKPIGAEEGTQQPKPGSEVSKKEIDQSDEEELFQRKINNRIIPTHMNEALGIIHGARTLPIVKNWDGKTDKEGLKKIEEVVWSKYSIAIVQRSDDTLFLAIPFMRRQNGNEQYKLELIELTKEGWKYHQKSDDDISELFLGWSEPIGDLAFGQEFFIVDRIKRHNMNSQGIGSMKPFEKDANTNLKILPTDAYLEGKQLEEFMSLGFDYYETKENGMIYFIE